MRATCPAPLVLCLTHAGKLAKSAVVRWYLRGIGAEQTTDFLQRSLHCLEGKDLSDVNNIYSFTGLHQSRCVKYETHKKLKPFCRVGLNSNQVKSWCLTRTLVQSLEPRVASEQRFRESRLASSKGFEHRSKGCIGAKEKWGHAASCFCFSLEAFLRTVQGFRGRSW